jgi:hypothetical protein
MGKLFYREAFPYLQSAMGAAHRDRANTGQP